MDDRERWRLMESWADIVARSKAKRRQKEWDETVREMKRSRDGKVARDAGRVKQEIAGATMPLADETGE